MEAPLKIKPLERLIQLLESDVEPKLRQRNTLYLDRERV